MDHKHTVAVFGATGRLGMHIVRQALERGWKVRAMVRSPEKFQAAFPDVFVVQGTFSDEGKVLETLEGCEAVFSALGSRHNKPSTEITDATTLILRLMMQQGGDLSRFLMVAGAGVRMEGDKPGAVDKFFAGLLKLVAKNVLADMTGAVDAVLKAPRDSIVWTVARVPRLLDATEAAGPVKTGMVGDPNLGVSVERSHVATFLLDSFEKQEYLHMAPMVSD